MAEKQASAWCSTCQTQRLFAAQKPNHVLHLILTLVTLGIWLIPWLIIGGKTGPYRCKVCGTPLKEVIAPPPPPV